ncbi:MAG: hypothetical protein A3F84_05795 [Candidatus Handelsmanbacteria bacterium RIFCSPLOWO2_12_FULL_64_10]|uniref:Uncharacterized protein n=1 Tax=Handelsmanbacteria sp. (strain RIFCSPLOWO2_12_FULL_64_10) TaxID=1817868 RepID=A0A1F6C9H9_HANXR|nr:MAG: hypothetical protein A3F84_05795 [Candidatus Handelsmanbacteria bacterium RIFCSPLOWO2_12_FULL_64_10]
MTTLTKLCVWASLIVGLGAMLFLGYQAGMGIVQDWEDLAGSEPAPQASVGDLAWIGGLLFAALLALAIRFRPHMRAKKTEVKGTGPKPLPHLGPFRRPGRKNAMGAGF